MGAFVETSKMVKMKVTVLNNNICMGSPLSCSSLHGPWVRLWSHKQKVLSSNPTFCIREKFRQWSVLRITSKISPILISPNAH